MISQYFALTFIMGALLALVLISSAQRAMALPPEISYMQLRTSQGDYLNPDQIPVPQSQSMVPITFTYRGIDNDNRVTHFICAWNVGSPPGSSSYSQSNCGNSWVEPRMMQRGSDGVVRNYYSVAGTVTGLRMFTTTPTFFGVKVVNDAGTPSQERTWIFGMNRIPAGAFAAVDRNYPPVVEIGKHAVYTSPGITQQIPYHGSTPLHHMIFTFWITRPVLPERPYFDCVWDDGPRVPCGHQMYPYPAASQYISGVTDGYHHVTVRGWYAGSLPSAEQRFSWCVSRTGGCVANSETPGWMRVVAPSVPSGGVPPAGINESSIFPDTGLNKVIIGNETVRLSGTIVGVNTSMPNKTTTEIPILWKQVEGPMVKLNSTNSLAVEFLAPLVKNDTFLKFSLTGSDPKGHNATDTNTLFLVTKGNAQKYKGTFCDTMVTKALEQINYPRNNTLESKDKNDNKSAQTNIDRAVKYLSECKGPLDQYANLLGNVTKIFPVLNMTGAATNITNITKQLETPDLGKVTTDIKN